MCALTLAACDNNPKSEDSADQVNTVNSETLLGSDLDKNGIRDDVEDHIKQLSITEVQKSATRFEAKVLQDTLTVDVENPNAMKGSNQNMIAAINCMNSQFENYEEADAIGVTLEDMTFNTDQRASTYERYNSVLADSELAIEIPTGDSCQAV